MIPVGLQNMSPTTDSFFFFSKILKKNGGWVTYHLNSDPESSLAASKTS